jgi:hypothetical protein
MSKKILGRYALSNKRDLSDDDRIRAHYLENMDLPARLQEKLSRMEQINAWFAEGNSTENVAKMISTTFNIAKSQAYSIIRDTRSLFGDIGKINKDHQRYILIERYTAISDQAKEKGDIYLQKECLDAIAKICGLHHPDQAELIDVTKLELPVSITFTSDPKALIEEAEHEDVTHG